MPVCRGIRGATTAAANSVPAILTATTELLEAIIEQNHIRLADIASAIFTVTDDLDAAFPALAAREMGWGDVPLLCAREIAVPGGPPRCIRVLLHVNTDRAQHLIHHVYLRDATVLRPEFVQQPVQ